jgi:hypothetical protein
MQRLTFLRCDRPQEHDWTFALSLDGVPDGPDAMTL